MMAASREKSNFIILKIIVIHEIIKMNSLDEINDNLIFSSYLIRTV